MTSIDDPSRPPKSDFPDDSSESVEHRLLRIERLVGVLVFVALVQAGLLCIIAIGDFLPSIFRTLVLLSLIVAFVIVFRKQIPIWFGKLIRSVFSHLDQ